MYKELYKSSKELISADSLLIVSYVQGALLLLFFHNKLLFYNDIVKKVLSFYSSASCYAALFAQQKQPNKVAENRGSRQSFQGDWK